MLPVLLIHGFASASSDMRFLEAFLRGRGLKVFCLQYAEDSVTSTATTDLLTQMKSLDASIRDVIQSNCQDFEDGFNIMAHSQGAVLARGAIILSGLAVSCKVHRFISLSGPHLGLRQMTDEMIAISSGLAHPAHRDQIQSFLGRCATEVASGNVHSVVRLRKGVLSNFAPVFLYRPMHELPEEVDFLWEFTEGIDEVPNAEANALAVDEYVFFAGADDGVVDTASALFQEPADGFPLTWQRIEDSGRVQRQIFDGVGHADWLSPTHAKVWKQLFEHLTRESSEVVLKTSLDNMQESVVR